MGGGKKITLWFVYGRHFYRPWNKDMRNEVPIMMTTSGSLTVSSKYWAGSQFQSLCIKAYFPLPFGYPHLSSKIFTFLMCRNSWLLIISTHLSKAQTKLNVPKESGHICEHLCLKLLKVALSIPSCHFYLSWFSRQ